MLQNIYLENPDESRVGNPLFVFLSKSLVFCEQKGEIAICSKGIKRGKAVKNCKNKAKTKNLFRANHSHHSLLKSDLLTVALHRERFFERKSKERKSEDRKSKDRKSNWYY